jgi:hypothetical protein
MRTVVQLTLEFAVADGTKLRLDLLIVHESLNPFKLAVAEVTILSLVALATNVVRVQTKLLQIQNQSAS